ncbi:hypothetical protein ScalyP_jg972 [Parmales sp. scaly parma]|nr:hypothetical protein ScalyP_jg972 [Parmales sp. scaly parma]
MPSAIRRSSSSTSTPSPDFDSSVLRWESPLSNGQVRRNSLTITEANTKLKDSTSFITTITEVFTSPFRNPLKTPPRKELQDPVTLHVFGSPTAKQMTPKDRKKRRVSFRNGFEMPGVGAGAGAKAQSPKNLASLATEFSPRQKRKSIDDNVVDLDPPRKKSRSRK